MLGREWDGLRQHITNNLAKWQEWTSSTEPHEASPPEPYSSLNDFKIMLLLRILRQDKLVLAMSQYVSRNLGREFTVSPAIILREIFPDSNSASPIIFLLSPGSDPTAMIFKFADECKKGDRLHTLSLGQGQGATAEKLIMFAQRKVLVCVFLCVCACVCVCVCLCVLEAGRDC